MYQIIIISDINQSDGYNTLWSGTRHGGYGTNQMYQIIIISDINQSDGQKWIEEGIESSEISLLSEVDYVLCIDGVGQGTHLNMHVSKPPKEGSHGYQLLQVVNIIIEND